MLDIERLLHIPLLVQKNWDFVHRLDIEKYYVDCMYKSKEQNRNFSPQVPIEEIFPAARNIIEVLNGFVVENSHSELGLGDSCNIIEFDFFEYDSSVFNKLQAIQKQLGKKVLFIGIGYDIIGDWLVDEDGAIYFLDKIRECLHFMSEDIYCFLEQDIFQLVDKNGAFIFADGLG